MKVGVAPKRGAAVKKEIEEQFRFNLDRVSQLVTLFETNAGGAGRPTVAQSDILRAAVVMLHATLEDLLRSFESWKIPTLPADALARIPLKGTKQEKFSLVELADFRGQTVDAVIEQSCTEKLERSNYNNVSEIVDILRRLGVQTDELMRAHGSVLSVLMSRRHLIVHRFDRNDQQGKGQHVARPISAAIVRKWLDTVRAFGNDLLGQPAQ